MPADRARRGEHVLQLGGAVLAGRRADRDDLQLAVRHARRDVGGEDEPPGVAVAMHDRLESRLEDRNLRLVQHRDLLLVDV